MFSTSKHTCTAAALLAVFLSACSVNVTPTPQYRGQVQPLPPLGSPNPVPVRYTLAPRHWTDVAKIRAEAQRLGMQVSAGKISKVQAAQHLNRFRLGLVGHNQVDDSMYDVYLRAAVDSQRGAIDSAQSKAMVESSLQGWARRWHDMPQRPENPAFTNFLMEHMGLPPLK